MSKINIECLCGKKKGVLNSTNWNRHVMSCKVMLSKKKCSDISSFFKRPATTGKNELNTMREKQRFGKY